MTSIFEGWKLVSHRGCWDGSACSILFQAMDGKDVVLVSPGQNADEVAQDLFCNFAGNILFADISVSMNVAKILDARRHDIVLLDHHASAISLKEFSWCQIEEKNQRSGAMMLFDWISNHFFNGEPPKELKAYSDFVKYADDYDRWQKQYPKKTQELSLFHSCLGQQMFIERFVNNPSPVLKSEEQYLVSIDEKKKQQKIKQAKKDVQVVNKVIDGVERRVAFLDNRGHHSEIAEAIYDDLELNVDLVVMVGDRISFRAPARSDVDCSKLAVKWFGGGHSKSSGTALRNVLGHTPIEMVMEKM